MSAPAETPNRDRLPVRMRGITKQYASQKVVDAVSVEFLPGEVHVLAGENGAGKSTLVKILCGAVGHYEGEIEIGDQPTRFATPHQAAQAGLSIIHQELSLIPEMSVVDNLVLGTEVCRFGFVRTASSREEARRLLAFVGLDLDIDTLVRDLPISLCQLVEIAKALRSAGRLIVMDEPTSALNSTDAERLFDVIAKLKADGRIVVYISHRMEEIRRLADRITVLRDGHHIGTYPASELTDDGLITLMVGDKEILTPASNSENAGFGPAVLALRGVNVTRGPTTLVSNASLEVKAGEVVGLAGLQGSGCSELLHALFGSSGKATGEIEVLGRKFVPHNPKSSIKNGMALLTNDRKGSGLVLPLSVTDNTTLAALPSLSPRGWRKTANEQAAAAKMAKDFHLRAPSLDAAVGSLSGGNQQKVALAKWALTQPKLMLLDEPTRGIDVGAKREIYALIERWKSEGLAILLITSELPELLMLSDRIVVMHRGHVVRTLDRAEATGEKVIEAAMNKEVA